MPDAPPYAAQGDPERSRLHEEWREPKGEGGAPVAQGQVFSGSSPALPTEGRELVCEPGTVVSSSVRSETFDTRHQSLLTIVLIFGRPRSSSSAER